MFEFFLRKTCMRTLSKEDQYHLMLLKDKFKMELLAQFFVCLFGVLPLASFMTLLITSEHTLDNIIAYIIFILAYSVFALYFGKRFNEQIVIFQILITASLYSSRYVLKGNAISKNDFDIIKEKKENLYFFMVTQQLHGYCYSVCFSLLKCLKKGSMQFIAVKCLENEKEKNGNKEYTMHVLYVNNDWCFDTYSQRQYPLSEVMKRLYAKTYTNFDYEAIKDLTYEEFIAKHSDALKVWCQENDCYQKLSKE